MSFEPTLPQPSVPPDVLLGASVLYIRANLQTSEQALIDGVTAQVPESPEAFSMRIAWYATAAQQLGYIAADNFDDLRDWVGAQSDAQIAAQSKILFAEAEKLPQVKLLRLEQQIIALQNIVGPVGARRDAATAALATEDGQPVTMTADLRQVVTDGQQYAQASLDSLSRELTPRLEQWSTSTGVELDA